MNLFKFFLLAALVFVFLVGLLNFNFFWQNLRFSFKKPAVLPRQQLMSEGKTAEPDMLSIENLGIYAPVNYVSDKTEKVFQAALANGVVHYPGTALPGQTGNVYIFGHSSDLPWSQGRYKTVFALLPRIRKGDKIFLSNSAGKVFTYAVTNAFVASADDLKYLDPVNSKKILTLQTSWPIGTALKRYIVQAELINP